MPPSQSTALNNYSKYWTLPPVALEGELCFSKDFKITNSIYYLQGEGKGKGPYCYYYNNFLVASATLVVTQWHSRS